jgi:hypothetical protein
MFLGILVFMLLGSFFIILLFIMVISIREPMFVSISGRSAIRFLVMLDMDGLMWVRSWERVYVLLV